MSKEMREKTLKHTSLHTLNESEPCFKSTFRSIDIKNYIWTATTKNWRYLIKIVNFDKKLYFVLSSGHCSNSLNLTIPCPTFYLGLMPL
jgi:hypothetical protein